MLTWIRKIATAIIQLVVFAWLTLYYITESFIYAVTPSSLWHKKNLAGKTVLITGGAGGVGQELAISLARHHARVIIWDNNEKALEKVEETIKSEGYKVHAYPVDISDKENVYKYAEMVKKDIGPVDILINNAGIVCGQTFLELPDYMIEKTFKVNILSHFWTTKAFLPNMIKSGKGHIVTVSSLTGFLGTYKCTDYSASKYATVGFHESLLIELKMHGYHDIKMSIIAPYFINTGMFSGCQPKSFEMLEPKQVAERIITAIRNEEEFVTIPTSARFLLPIKFYLPAKLFWDVILKIVQTPQAMMGMRNFEEVEAA